MNQFLKSTYTNLEPVRILQSPTSVLLGISTKIAGLLKSALNIRTVFDLATSHVFATADLIVRSAEGEATVVSQSGMLSSDVIDTTILVTETPNCNELVSKDIECLSGIGPVTAPLLKEALDTATIRDLAYWPPYVNACKVLQSLSTETPSSINDGETPLDLLPATGQYPTERTQYNMLVFDHLLASAPLTPIEDGIRVDVLAAQDMLARANVPALGALLSFTQSWYTLGLTLGQLLHSLALAPGESTRVAVVDWYRRIQSAVAESGQEQEMLISDVTRNRSLNEVVSAVAAEFQSGQAKTFTSSESGEFGVGFGYGTGTGATGSGSYGAFSGLASVGDALGLGISGGYAKGTGKAWTWASSVGKREMAADMTQRIIDQTHQASMMTRNRWASVVREVSQKEHETLSTRSITNFNHMHALTVQYYEVIQLYRMVVELSKVTRCLFVPMKQLDFGDPAVVMRFRYLLANAALIQSVRALAIAEPDSLLLGFPITHHLEKSIQQSWESNAWSILTTNHVTAAIPKETSFKVNLFRIHSSTGPDIPFQSLIVELQDGTWKECNWKRDVAQDFFIVSVKELFGRDDIELTSIRQVLLRKANGQEAVTGIYNNVIPYFQQSPGSMGNAFASAALPSIDVWPGGSHSSPGRSRHSLSRYGQGWPRILRRTACITTRPFGSRLIRPRSPTCSPHTHLPASLC